MILDSLNAMRDLVQEDVGNRGLRADPEHNLITATTGDFVAACTSLAGARSPILGIVTGFFIPSADPPAGETDGPLGAVYLARALHPLGITVVICAEDFCTRAIGAALAACGLQARVPVLTLAVPGDMERMTETTAVGDVTHLLALERVGPSYTGRYYSMRGVDVTNFMSSIAQSLFEFSRPAVTIGIGDGGNEIGMGKIARDVIARNIPRGELIACRVPTDHLIVAGVSNWGAYALAAGVYALRGVAPAPELFDPDIERRILEVMVAEGPLVDGVLGRPSATVDGLSWDRYAAVLPRLREILECP